MPIQIYFPGGVAVAAQLDSFEILTDQPVAAGGAGSAPSPYDLFLASIGTCAGFFALRFCQERNLATEGLGLTLDYQRHPETRALQQIAIKIKLPAGFPEKYRTAIIKATDQCSVKKALLAAPDISVTSE